MAGRSRPRAPVARKRGRSPLDAHHLPQRMHDLHQVALRRHHRVDVLVRGGRLVDHARVLAAFDVRGGLAMLLQRDSCACGGAAHHAAGAVAAAVEAVRVALAAHDETACAHAARDDAELALTRADRALPRDQQRFAEVVLALHVVVMAVHRRLLRLELRQAVAHLVQHARHHRLAVHTRVVLRPRDRFDVLVEQRLAFEEEREVAIGHVETEHALLQLATRQFDEVRADEVAGSARTRMQHHPHAIGLVQADLDEVVAAAERADLAIELVRTDLRMLLADLRQPRDEVGLLQRRLHAVGNPAVLAARTVADRDAALDGVAQQRQVVGQVVGSQRRANRGHAAADVDADRGRDDRALRRHDRSHRRADAQVHVGHHRDPRPDEGQGGDVAQLLPRLVLDRHAVRPALDRRGRTFGVQQVE